MLNKKIEIKGKIIYLKTLDKKNATKEYCSWLNDAEVNQYLETKEATIDEVKKYIKEKNQNPNCLFLGIFYRENEKHIGNIKLEPIDFKNYKATIGILIGEKDYWGKGIGTEAIELLVDYGFKDLKLREINLGVASQNKSAIRVYEKTGFKFDKIIKKNKIIMLIKNEK